MLRAKIGEGGMGVVHLATDPAGRAVAVKLLRPHVIGDEHGRARMAREVTSLRRVRSPRVAEVYDADPWGDTAYIVTRYIPGPSLYAHVHSNGPIREPWLSELATGLAEALASVHAVDVLHRDVKPSNVLIDGTGPVLIDFGLAQLADDTRLTYSGWLLGTPGYLAPEILYGGEPTALADVHSWAATVVFAATGRGPYGSGPAVAVMDRVRRGEHDLSGVSDRLYWQIRQALSPDPLDRPSAAALVDWLSGGLVPDVPRTGRLDIVEATHVPVPLDAPRRQASRASQAVFWLAVLAVFVALAVSAPVVAGLCLALSAWAVRTSVVRARRLSAWQRQRGPRRTDGFLATLCTPWFALVGLGASLVNAGFGLAGGVLAILVATLATPPWTLVFVLSFGAVVACGFTWWGPFSHDVRTGGRALTDALLRSAGNVALAIVVLAVLAGAILLARQVAGPAYAPLPDPPWGKLIADRLA